MERWQLKVMTMFIAFFLASFMVILPVKVAGFMLSKGKTGAFILEALECAGGGIFLGAYLIFLAPEIRHILNTYLLEAQNIDYPIPEVLTGLGLFFVVYSEFFFSYLNARSEEKARQKLKEEATGGGGGEVKWTKKKPDSQGGEKVVQLTSVKSVGGEMNAAFEKGDESKVDPNIQNGAPSAVVVTEHKIDKEEELSEEAAKLKSKRKIQVLILVIALGFGNIFEGLTLGLQTTPSGVYSIFIAIVAHELVLCFCLGLQLVQTMSIKAAVFCGVGQVVAIPVGASIGIALYESSGTAPSDTIQVVNGALQGFASGAFLFVSFFGIMAKGLYEHPHIGKHLSATAGFVFMIIVRALPLPKGDEGILAGNDTCVVVHPHADNLYSVWYHH